MHRDHELGAESGGREITERQQIRTRRGVVRATPPRVGGGDVDRERDVDGAGEDDLLIAPGGDLGDGGGDATAIVLRVDSHIDRARLAGSACREGDLEEKTCSFGIGGAGVHAIRVDEGLELGGDDQMREDRVVGNTVEDAWYGAQKSKPTQP